MTGAGGFVASHLVERLKSDGIWVRGVDRKEGALEEVAPKDAAAIGTPSGSPSEAVLSPL